MPVSRRSVLSSLALAMSVVPAVAQDKPAAKPAVKPAASKAPPAPDPLLTAEPRLLPVAMGEATLFGPQEPALPVITLGGEFAPVIRVKQGEVTALRFENRLSEPMALHPHGLRFANAVDGTPGLTQEAIPPGGAQEFRFLPKDGTLAVLRASAEGEAGRRQWDQGLAAFLVIEETKPQPSDADLALVFHDWTHRLKERDAVRAAKSEAAKSEAATSDAAKDAAPPRPVPVYANALDRVDIPVKTGTRLRLRLANLSAGQLLQITAPGHALSLLALDGAPSDSFRIDKSILLLAPGQTADVMFDCTMAPGTQAPIFVANGQGKAEAVRLVYGAEALTRDPLPPIGALPPANLAQDMDFSRAARATLTLTQADGKTALNGRFEPGRGAKPILTSREKGVVILTLENKTEQIQCFHVHGHLARLLDELDDGWKPYWLNSVVIPAQGLGRIAFSTDRPGKWQVDITAIGATDHGLAAWFEVSANRPQAKKPLQNNGQEAGTVVSEEAEAGLSAYVPMYPDSR